jgi:hypothetical protein
MWMKMAFNRLGSCANSYKKYSNLHLSWRSSALGAAALLGRRVLEGWLFGNNALFVKTGLLAAIRSKQISARW